MENPLKTQKGLLYFPVGSALGTKHLFDWTRRDNPIYNYNALLIAYGQARDKLSVLKQLKDDGCYIMVDSGGFQVVQLGVELNPVGVVELQQEVGNCGFILDEPLTGMLDRSRAISVNEVEKKADKTRKNIEAAKGFVRNDFEWLGILQFYPPVPDIWWDLCISDFLDSFAGIGIAPRSSDDKVGAYGWTISALLALSYLREKGYKGWVHLLGLGMPAVMWVSSWWVDHFERISLDSTTPLTAMRYGTVYTSLTGNKVSKVGSLLEGKKINFCNCEVCSRAEKLGITMDYRNLSRILVLHNLYYIVSYADQLNRIKKGGYPEEFLLGLRPTTKEGVFGHLPTLVKASLEYTFEEFRKKVNDMFLYTRGMNQDIVTSKAELEESITKKFMFGEEGKKSVETTKLW